MSINSGIVTKLNQMYEDFPKKLTINDEKRSFAQKFMGFKPWISDSINSFGRQLLFSSVVNDAVKNDKIIYITAVSELVYDKIPTPHPSKVRYDEFIKVHGYYSFSFDSNDKLASTSASHRATYDSKKLIEICPYICQFDTEFGIDTSDVDSNIVNMIGLINIGSAMTDLMEEYFNNHKYMKKINDKGLGYTFSKINNVKIPKNIAIANDIIDEIFTLDDLVEERMILEQSQKYSMQHF